MSDTVDLSNLRKPFTGSQVSKLPKPTKAQTEEVRKDFKAGFRCPICEGWHHPKVVHLDYVGHAALTDRLLDTDSYWTWEPVAFDEDGLPAFDKSGGLWIRLTVLGVTRLGYGHANTKPNADAGSREKEVIGDALRNAAMRFGAALDLWHKGDLHGEEETPAEPQGMPEAQQMPDAEWAKLTGLIKATGSNIGDMVKHYEVANLRLLNQEQYAHCLGKLTDKLAAQAKAQTDAKAAEPKPGFGEILEDSIPF